MLSKPLALKSDFPWFKAHPKTSYLDTAATALKPKIVLDALYKHYVNNGTSTHATHSLPADQTLRMYQEAKEIVANFVNATSWQEIVFGYNTTQLLNDLSRMIAQQLVPGDEVILSHLEHTSNLLPWMVLQNERCLKIRYASLTNYVVTPSTVQQQLTSRTRVVSLAHVSNTFGGVSDVAGICEVVKNYNPKIIVVLDAAQAISHLKVDVQALNCDFLVFSAHKMYAPEGLGIMYGRYELLDLYQPVNFGGGMNTRVDESGFINALPPAKFESGTPNTGAAAGLIAACKYLQMIGLDRIHAHEQTLKSALVSRLKSNSRISVYNATIPGATVLFNCKGVFSEDLAAYLGFKARVLVRSGEACAKLVKRFLPETNFVRVSFGIYNDATDIERLAAALEGEVDYLEGII